MGIFNLKFADYFLAVSAYSVDAYIQPFGYFGTFQPIVYQRKDLALTRCEERVVFLESKLFGKTSNGIDCMAFAFEIEGQRLINADCIADILILLVEDIIHSVQHIVLFAIDKSKTQF